MSEEVNGSSLTEAQVAAPVTAPAAEPAAPAQTNGEAADTAQAEDGPSDPPAVEASSGVEGEDTVTPASGKKEKRKSTGGGVPEHKGKKLNKKKSMPSLHLECKPGDFYWARLKGYPPWPSIICDEQMLPESLLASRPVSTTRPDGSLRDDFKEGGKNAKERTFPVMFLATNEFTWMVNTSLTPLDPEECKTPKGKLSKDLQKAWEIASENHDLDYFKHILKEWQEEQARFEKELREFEEKEAAEAEKRAEEAEAAKAADDAAKAKKSKKARKSKGGDEDVEMEDADAPKSTKKRKKETESDGEGIKPKKTPKVTKLNAPKTPNGDASATKASAKSKKKVVQAPKDDVEDEKPQMTEKEKYAQRENAVLYLRHKLQKGFLTRDQAPLETEMAAMADHFHHLESYREIEPAIIRATKVHKVLKAIIKLAAIPKEEEYQFKKRSAAMLEVWNKSMEADGDAAARPATSADEKTKEEPETAEPASETNGDKAAASATIVTKDEGGEEATEEKAEQAVKQLDEKIEDAPEKTAGPPPEPAAATLDKLDAAANPVDAATDGDAAKDVTAATETTVAEGA